MSDMKKWLDLMESAVAEKKKSPAGGPACWKGKKIHPTKPTKMKGGKRVNNCIDAGTNESIEGLDEAACPTCAGRGHRPAAGGMDRPCDACDGTGKVEQSAEESFDPSAEPSHQDELMDIYLQNGEEALADALGLTPEQLDQEINEIGFEHGLHADDDREEIIYKIIDDTISNADMDMHEASDDCDHTCPKSCPDCGGTGVAKKKVDESYPMGMDPDNNTNVSFNQTKKIGDATLNIHAQAKDMEELQKVLQMAGLDPDGAEKHMPEPDSVQVVSVDPMPNTSCDDTRYNTDKNTLIDVLRSKLQAKL